MLRPAKHGQWWQRQRTLCLCACDQRIAVCEASNRRGFQMQTDKLTNCLLFSTNLLYMSDQGCIVQSVLMYSVAFALRLEFSKCSEGSMNQNTNLRHNDFANESHEMLKVKVLKRAIVGRWQLQQYWRLFHRNQCLVRIELNCRKKKEEINCFHVHCLLVLILLFTIFRLASFRLLYLRWPFVFGRPSLVIAWKSNEPSLS